AEVEVLVTEVKVPVEEQRVGVCKVLDLVTGVYAMGDEREESREEEQQRHKPTVQRRIEDGGVQGAPCRGLGGVPQSYPYPIFIHWGVRPLIVIPRLHTIPSVL